jgi:hypothetical protein
VAHLESTDEERREQQLHLGTDPSEASDAAVAMVSAQLANTLGGSLAQAQGGPQRITQPAKLARLVAQGTQALEAAQRELRERTAEKFERECATQ